MHHAAIRLATHRNLRPLLLILLFGIGCGPGDKLYGPLPDGEALSTIVGVWVGQVDGQTVTLTVCEDEAKGASFGDQGDCQQDHVVSSLSKDHIENHSGIGCGGCPFSVDAPIKARLVHGDISVDLDLGGSVHLGDGYDDDPYALPYTLDVRQDQQALSGTIGSRGKLELSSEGIVGFPAARLPRTMTLSRSTPDCSWTSSS